MLGKLRHCERLAMSLWPPSSSANTTLQCAQHLRLFHPVEARALPGVGIGLDDPGARVLLVLIAVREQNAVLGLLEEILEGVERPGRAQPHELVRPQIHRGLEVVAVRLARARIDAVCRNDEVAVREILDARFGLEVQLHAQLAAAFLQQLEQGHARAAAEAVAAAAQGAALDHDVHVAPVGEAPADRFVRGLVVIAKRPECRVGEHYAEAEGVVGAVALVDRDVPAWPSLLCEQREVQSARSAADDAHLHRMRL